MTATLLPQSEITSAPSQTAPSLWRTGIRAGILAAMATTVIAVAASGLGVSFEVDGEAIPVAGFAQMTLIGVLVGVGLAKSLRRWAGNPRQAFVRTTVALTALSVVPDLTMGFDAASAAVLVLTHVAAAAIVIPRLAARLGE